VSGVATKKPAVEHPSLGWIHPELSDGRRVCIRDHAIAVIRVLYRLIRPALTKIKIFFTAGGGRDDKVTW
jgi:hypothetical protein